jgi:hypothetical protein
MIFFLLLLDVISIAHLFWLIIIKHFFYYSYVINAYNLNHIIRLPNLIKCSRINDCSMDFSFLFYKYCCGRARFAVVF